MTVRVLVIDDSAFARKVVREVLSADPRLEVIDTARDGLDALEKIERLRPDVITLDLVMPHLDGIGVLRALPAEGGPRVVVVGISGTASDLGIEALELGAFDLVEKPTALATDRLYEIGDELVDKVIAAAAAPRPAPHPPSARVPRVLAVAAGKTRLVAIGASTGGPPAISRVLAAMPVGLEVPIAIVIHLPPEYTDAFARRLDGACPLRVREASDGLRLVPGEVAIARGGIHLKLGRDGDGMVCHLDDAPTDRLHRPAVDVLFSSAAEVYGAGVLGVVLTGMGDDGCAGARAIRDAGGRVLTQSERSCTVYGMPRCVVDAGLSSGEADIEDMAARIVASL